MTVLSTQWRMGPGGPIGLDYSQLDLGYRAAGIRRRERRDTFDAIQVLEAEALKVLHER